MTKKPSKLGFVKTKAAKPVKKSRLIPAAKLFPKIKTTKPVSAAPKEISYISLPKASLCEIYDQGWECAFLHKGAEGFVQACVWMHCKDFLNDAVWGHHKNCSAGIYGFQYDPKKNAPLDFDKIRLLSRDSTVKTAGKFAGMSAKALILLNKIEDLMGFEHSRMVQARCSKSKADGEFYYEGDGRWMHSSPLLSFYTCLVRAGVFYDGTSDPVAFLSSYNIKSNDRSYLSSGLANGAVKALIQYNVKLFDADPKKNYEVGSIGTMHNLGVQTWSYRFPKMDTQSAPWKYWRTSA